MLLTHLLSKNLNHRISNSAVEVEVLTIGKKVFDAVKKNRTVYDNQSAIFDHVSFEKVSKVTSAVMKDFSQGKFDEVHLIYNKFLNAAIKK